MLATVPAEQTVVKVLCLLKDVDIERLGRSLTIILCPEYLTHVCAALNSGLNNPAERVSTGSLLRRAAEILDHTECYLVGSEDPEALLLIVEAREQGLWTIQTFLTRYKKGYSLSVQSPLGGD